MTYQEIAKKLEVTPEELEKESLEIYLRQKLRHFEAEIFKITTKHGVNDVFQMDEMIKNGQIHEKNSWQDFFLLDNMEAETKKIKELLDSI